MDIFEGALGGLSNKSKTNDFFLKHTSLQQTHKGHTKTKHKHN